jgi:hypothetical protein
MVGLALLIFVPVAVIFITIQTAAASTTIADFNTTQVTLTPSPTPTVLTPTFEPDIETLLKTLLTQEMSSVDGVVLTTELERLLDELTEGQSQIAVEYDDNGDGEEEKTLTITIAPIGLTTPIEETEAKEEPTEDSAQDDSSSNGGGNGDDNGDDD